MNEEEVVIDIIYNMTAEQRVFITWLLELTPEEQAEAVEYIKAFEDFGEDFSTRVEKFGIKKLSWKKL